jgi:peptidoglycan/LPS O-acetylase OafA/YrhL
MQNRKTGFHTIDAFRFFAFFKVYMLHLAVDREFCIFSFLKRGGGIGVVFFFVLSGFLISYNLVTEQSKQGGVNLWRFYLKRILRIWPLFYLFLLLLYLTPYHIENSLGLISGGYISDWHFSFLFLENYKIILSRGFPAIAPLLVTWSLCIEEHFYIIWGILAIVTPARQVGPALVALIIVAIVSRILSKIYLPGYDISTNEIITSLDYFAIGGLVGWFYALHAKRFDRFILSIPLFVRWGYVAVAVIFVFTNFLLEPAMHLPKCLGPAFDSIIFAGLIAMVLPRESEIRIGEDSILSYLGRISYGLYLFHPLFTGIFAHYCSSYHIRIDTWGMLVIAFLFTFIPTVLMASFLYHFYERPILSLRKYL